MIIVRLLLKEMQSFHLLHLASVASLLLVLQCVMLAKSNHFIRGLKNHMKCILHLILINRLCGFLEGV